MKLYPPSIEGKLPACAGGSLVIPLTMNRAVSSQNVTGMTAIIKNISTGRKVAELTNGTLVKSDGGYYASFENEKEKNAIANLNIGQYYKIQIAYKDKNDIGYYSPVGIFKRTTTPDVRIPALEENFYGRYEYTGVYSQKNGDETEKIYSYCFELSDINGNIVDTSGIQIHNSENDDDTIVETQDTWRSTIEMIKDTPYYLTYKVTTMNGLTASSPRYTTMNEDSIDIDIDIELQSILNSDEGCVELSILPKDNKDLVLSGSFVLVRSSSKNNFNSWDEVYKFSYLNTTVSRKSPILLWEDCTVEQGEEYLYALQAYNSRELYSNRLNAKNGKVKIDFVDAFLYDGERQLKIQFNPKVSSFKNTILETKMDTLGSKYPFIFRNGYVHYKEFQISGLISLLSDSSGKFRRNKKEIAGASSTGRLSTPAFGEVSSDLTTDLTAANIYNERQFKIDVLEWLNNGEAKIFRSPTEGNYIVRLMNVSLTPNDTLGRMLHTFQCTAYEIAEWNFKNLVNANLIELPENSTTNLKIGQIAPSEMLKLSKEEFKNNYPDFTIEDNTNISFGKSAYNVNLTEATPGTTVGLVFSQGNKEQPMVSIEIGGTGAYYIQTREYPLTALYLLSGDWDNMKVTFEYYDDTPTDTFSNIADISMTDEIRRFIGPGYHMNLVKSTSDSYANSNNIIGDIRRDIGSFHYIRAEKRYIQEIWQVPINGKTRYSRNSYGNDLIADNEWNPTVIYHNNTTGEYWDGAKNVKLQLITIKPDGTTTVENKPDFRFRLNSPNENVYVDLGGRPIEATDELQFGATFGRIDALRNVGDVEFLQIGNGLIVDVAYRVRTKEYVVESEDQATIDKKRIWLANKALIDDAIKNEKKSDAEIQKVIDRAHDSYRDFIIALKNALDKRGIIV